MSCARNQTAELLGAAVIYCTRCSPHELVSAADGNEIPTTQTEPGTERRARCISTRLTA